MDYSSYYQLFSGKNLTEFVCSQLISCVGLVMYKLNNKFIMVSELTVISEGNKTILWSI